MSTAIFLSNQEIKAVVGKKTGRQMTITRVYRAQAPEGSVINSQVINEKEFTSFLEEFWETHGLPRTDVVLTLGGTVSANRLMQVPEMPYKKVMEYLPREYGVADSGKDMIFSYVSRGRSGKLMDLYTSMIERSVLKPHLKRFEELGIKLSAVVPADVGRMTALDNLSCLDGKTCVIQVLDGVTLNNILYVDGKYYQHNTVRVFGDHTTPAFGVECARSVSGLQQFLKTKQIENPITNVYLCGEYGEEGMEICRESMLQMDGNLEVEVLEAEADGVIQYLAADQDPFNYFTAPIGALMIPVETGSLLKQYYHDPDKILQRKAWVRTALPFIAAAAVLGAAIAAEAGLWVAHTGKLSRQYEYLDNQQGIEQVVEYDRLNLENEKMKSRIAIITLTDEKLESYPVYTSQIKKTIQECAAGLAAVEMVSFDQIEGTVSVNASSRDAEGAHQFVNRLEERKNQFETIFYDGFVLDEKTGLWYSSIKCYLKTPVKDEEVTP